MPETPSQPMRLQQVHLGPFLVEETIGQGGMGRVWRARHRRSGTPVAVKVIEGELAPEVLTVFRDEVRAAARMDHPGTVRVFDAGAVGERAARASGGRLPLGGPFLAMELLTGGALDTGAVAPSWLHLRQTLLDILYALSHAHARGVVHRDLKPANILFAGPESDQPGLRITDFGIAHAFGQVRHDEDEDTIVGTPFYMAPEQHYARWWLQGPWTDLYALGCIAWEMINGRRPFDGSLYAVVFGHLNGEPEGWQPRLDVPDGLQEWVLRLLEKRPADRFERAADAAYALKELSSSRTLSQGLPPLPRTWRSPMRARRVPVNLLGTGLGLHGLRSIPVLGRDRQLGAAWAALRDVWQTASPRVVLFRGPSGCGVSRVAEFFCERTEEVGGACTLRVVHGSRPGRASSLGAAVARVLQIAGLPPETARERLVEWLADHGVDDPDDADRLLEAIGDPDPTQAAVTSEASRRAALLRFLTLWGRGRPVVLWLDDVQMGTRSLDFVEHVLEAGGPVLVLLCVEDESLARRPSEAERLERLGSGPHAQELFVPPLGLEDGLRLARDVLGLRPDVAMSVVERSEGKPTFTLELVGDWIARDLLEPGADGFTLRGSLEALLPADLDRLQDERIERLSNLHGPGSRECLEVAAALGRGVDGREWRAVCEQAGYSVPTGVLDSLVTEALAEATLGGWVFTDDLVPASLERSARRAGRWEAHHAACAAVIEVRYPAGLPGRARRLGHHLIEATVLERGVAFLEEAVEAEVSSGSAGRGLELVSRIEVTLDKLGAARGDLRWGRAALARVKGQLALGWLEPARDGARALRRRAQSLGWRDLEAAALGQEATVARLEGDLLGAEALTRGALGLPSVLTATRASVLLLQAQMRREACRFEEARATYREAEELLAEVGDQAAVVRAQLGIAAVELHDGRLDEAAALYRAVLPWVIDRGDRFAEATARNGLAAVAQLQGDRSAARQGYLQAWALLERLASPTAITSALNVAFLQAADRDWGGLERTLERVRNRKRMAVQRPWLAQMGLLQLLLLARTRQWSAWDAEFEQTRAVVPEAAAPPQDLAALALLLGEIVRKAGKPHRARAALMLAREFWEALDDVQRIREVDQLLSAL